MKKIPKKTRSSVVLIILLLPLMAGIVHGLNSRHPAAVLGVSVNANKTKRLKSVHYRKSRALCGIPKKNRARCFAEATLDDNGNLLSGQPAVVSGYGPTQFHTAYSLPCTPGGAVSSICSTPGSFGPATIAIVDAGNITSGGGTVESSLQAYDTYFGLPACTVANGCLSVVNESGATSPLPSSAGSSWELEIALDVEAAHMICQTCKIVLVEASTNSYLDLGTANNTAASYSPIAISNSWGGSDALGFESYFKHPGIATIASTGDTGALTSGQAFPADIPEVVSAAGTSLNLNVDNTWAGESVWSGSGGGCAANYSAPSWQTSLSNWSANGCGSSRAYGDVSADANPSTGAAVNWSGTWYQVGGTSLSSPLIAGMFALVGSIPTGTTASSIPYSSFTSANFHDVSNGSDCVTGGQLHCTASSGFDAPSGLGAPIGLGGFSPPPSQPSGFAATVTDQSHVNLSWTASTGNKAITGYRIYRNSSLLTTTSGTSYSNSGLSSNTSYTYHVIAVDSLGNLSPATTDSTVTTYYPADINGDSHVNIIDFSLLASKYGQSGAGVGRADINGDGTVNILDFSLLASSYAAE